MLLEASESVWGDLIEEMSDHDLLFALQNLDIDEQVYLLQHLPRDLTGRLLATLPADKRARIRQMMRYADNTVGAIMEFEVITVRPEATRGGTALSAATRENAGEHRQTVCDHPQ